MFVYFNLCESKMTEKDLPFTGAPLKCPQELGLGQAKIRSQEFHPHLPHGWESPKKLGSLPAASQEELTGSWIGSWGWTQSQALHLIREAGDHHLTLCAPLHLLWSARAMKKNRGSLKKSEFSHSFWCCYAYYHNIRILTVLKLPLSIQRS